MPTQILKFNNKYIKRTTNPNEYTKKNFSNFNINRSDNCQKPFIMPLNLFRKTTVCDDCVTNEKIYKDNTSMNFKHPACYDPYITKKQNINGIRDTSFVYNSFNLLYRDNKTFYQNTQSNYQSNDPINGTKHVFENSPKDISNNNVSKCSLSTMKFTNYLSQTNGASSGRHRIQALKRNAILGGQSNNSVNRTLISIQGVSGRKPYRNDKFFYNDMKRRNSNCALNKDSVNEYC